MTTSEQREKPVAPVAPAALAGMETVSIPLCDLGIDEEGDICQISINLRNSKKFIDVGFIRGEKVKMENRAPFGGLMRVNVMDTSVSLHHDDAKNILVRRHRRDDDGRHHHHHDPSGAAAPASAARLHHRSHH
jgi:Fe2+ transport system protein FeoA